MFEVLVRGRAFEFNVFQLVVAARGVDELTAFGQLQAVVLGSLEYGRGPGDFAGIVLSEWHPKKSFALIELAETAEHVDGHGGNVAGTYVE